MMPDGRAQDDVRPREQVAQARKQLAEHVDAAETPDAELECIPTFLEEQPAAVGRWRSRRRLMPDRHGRQLRSL